MKIDKISLEVAALKKQLSSVTNDVLKTSIEKKIKRLEIELKGANMSGVEYARTLLAGRKKIKQMSKDEFKEFIQLLSKKPEYSFLKQLTRQQIKDDFDRIAKPVGWRFRGRTNFAKPTRTDIRLGRNVYYENRSNRADVSTQVRLAKGGMIKHGLEIGDEIIGSIENAIEVKNNSKNYVVNINKGIRMTIEEYFDKYPTHKKSAKFKRMEQGGMTNGSGISNEKSQLLSEVYGDGSEYSSAKEFVEYVRDTDDDNDFKNISDAEINNWYKIHKSNFADIGGWD
jgi:hypothetical protein